MIDNKIVVGISQGDLNGISLEVILKSLHDPAMLDICIPVIFSSQKTIQFYRKALELDDFNFNVIKDFDQLNSKKVNVFSCYDEDVMIEIGKATPVSGKYSKLSLEAATQALLNNKTDVLVTGPFNKHAMKEAGFNYPGHTEYIGEKLGGAPLMLLCADALRVAVATGHIAVTEIKNHITTDKLISKITQLHQSLKLDFGIRKPKIAVLGLNPHAGENGEIGKEEITTIIPAIKKTSETMLVYGPYSADGFFGSETYKQFDGVLAMYHDQGLIPFKTLAFNSGVNYTAGLNAIRTSPDMARLTKLLEKTLPMNRRLKKPCI